MNTLTDDSQLEVVIRCAGCGCDDEHPCFGDKGPNEISVETSMDDLPPRCRWVAVAEEVGLGLCSRCAAKPLSELLV